jgi:hypothetical protein
MKTRASISNSSRFSADRPGMSCDLRRAMRVYVSARYITTM